MVKSHNEIPRGVKGRKSVVTPHHHSKRVISKCKQDRFKPVITLGQDQHSLAVHDPTNFYQMVKGITIDIDIPSNRERRRRLGGFKPVFDELSESYLIDLFNDTDLYAIHARRNGCESDI